MIHQEFIPIDEILTIHQILIHDRLSLFFFPWKEQISFTI